MCGIFCSLLSSSCHENKPPDETLEVCLANLQSRGPDYFQTVACNPSSGQTLLLSASVLQTQGKKLCPQPCVNDKTILCWNGDVFGGALVNEIHDAKLCDTEVVSQHLSSLMQGQSPIVVLNEIAGPYSFILYEKQTQTIWFGRDPVGRHSLLYEIDFPYKLTLTSVAHSNLPHIKELPAIGLFEVRVGQNQNDWSMALHPWEVLDEERLSELRESFGLTLEIRSPVCKQQYIFRPIVGSHSKPNEEDLCNIFSFPQSSCVEDKMKSISNSQMFHKNMISVLSLLEEAVKVRVETNVSLCQNCLSEMRSENDPCCHSKVAVLFSGGLDSAILARLVDKYVPQDEPIDLLNVAFEKIKSSQDRTRGKKKLEVKNGRHEIDISPFDEDSVYNVPDRQSGKKSLIELQNLCPHRQWNFIEINVPVAELREERTKCITHLIHPLKTILDDSLGCALWFAARGQGKICHTNENYRSPARIIITGMGADEQFGGYMRHRTTLKHHGWEALQTQLQMELKRIPLRNLGRDDRVISHHGRQPRMPFLDEEVIRFVKSLPPWERCCPTDRLPCGIGDKLLLRLVAWHIGLQGAAVLPKRAMQFGSRIANSKENAAETSDRL